MKEKKDAREEKTTANNEVLGNDVETPVQEKAADASVEEKGNELDGIKAELEEKNKKCEEYLDKYQRSVAEFDNFKKRTAREKEALYSEAVCDVTAVILPVVDNFERAVQACSKESDFQTLKDGVELVYRQLKEAFKKIGVEEINCNNACFDPQLHNAVMHVEDEGLGQNCVIEEFQKGYVYKDKVIRHSMVKVAN
jgi:Molecular chaperone GrpE (heat shock protein)